MENPMKITAVWAVEVLPKCSRHPEKSMMPPWSRLRAPLWSSRLTKMTHRKSPLFLWGVYHCLPRCLSLPNPLHRIQIPVRLVQIPVLVELYPTARISPFRVGSPPSEVCLWYLPSQVSLKTANRGHLTPGRKWYDRKERSTELLTCNGTTVLQ